MMYLAICLNILFCSDVNGPILGSVEKQFIVSQVLYSVPLMRSPEASRKQPYCAGLADHGNY